ncbi:hypothetical protein RhiirA4_477271 [Rhizophagus irregularis]|uniref:Uncharacterized protein n=1 Tax=Rhizophagus irregularis TaxID=588596 RepID=A0A2I1HD00_9GLOM|nr:hypothetical protein RhiirA4_477271 [Rhizophagus irregularis]
MFTAVFILFETNLRLHLYEYQDYKQAIQIKHIEHVLVEIIKAIDYAFLAWFKASVPTILKVPERSDFVNICKSCINKYEIKTTKKTNIDIFETAKVSPIVISEDKTNVEMNNLIPKLISKDENPIVVQNDNPYR